MNIIRIIILIFLAWAPYINICLAAYFLGDYANSWKVTVGVVCLSVGFLGAIVGVIERLEKNKRETQIDNELKAKKEELDIREVLNRHEELIAKNEELTRKNGELIELLRWNK